MKAEPESWIYNILMVFLTATDRQGFVFSLFSYETVAYANRFFFQPFAQHGFA